MAEELLLVNPRKRTKKRTKKPAARRQVVVVNPKPARKRHTRRRYHRNPVSSGVVRHHRRRYRKNPIGGIGEVLMPALQGAAGGLALDMIVGLPVVPASLKTGPMSYITKGAIALGIGILGKSLLGSGIGSNMARGAMIVALHDAGKSVLSSAGITMAGVNSIGYYPNAVHGMGYYPQRRLSGIGDINDGYTGE